MTQSFDEWFKDHEKEVFKNNQGCFDGGYKLGSKMGFNAGAQSRQAEIDELKKRIDDLTNINESLVAYKNQLLDDIEGKENETRFD